MRENQEGKQLKGGNQPYELVQKIGDGGAGSVYKAKGEDGRFRAIKILHPSTSTPSKNGRERFEREFKLMQRLEHPNIMPVEDQGEDEQLGFWFGMPYFEGVRTIADALIEGAISSDDLETYLKQTLNALEYAALNNAIHRDVKPENILHTPDGRIRLADFGLAKQHGTSMATVTAQGDLLGTPLYISPEQVRGIACTPMADLYSLAATFYHLYSNTPVYNDSKTQSELVMAAANGTPEFLNKRITELGKPLVPFHVEDVLMSWLAHDAEGRMDHRQGREWLMHRPNRELAEKFTEELDAKERRLREALGVESVAEMAETIPDNSAAQQILSQNKSSLGELVELHYKLAINLHPYGEWGDRRVDHLQVAMDMKDYAEHLSHEIDINLAAKLMELEERRVEQADSSPLFRHLRKFHSTRRTVVKQQSSIFITTEPRSKTSLLLGVGGAVLGTAAAFGGLWAASASVHSEYKALLAEAQTAITQQDYDGAREKLAAMKQKRNSRWLLFHESGTEGEEAVRKRIASHEHTLEQLAELESRANELKMEEGLKEFSETVEEMRQEALTYERASPERVKAVRETLSQQLARAYDSKLDGLVGRRVHLPLGEIEGHVRPYLQDLHSARELAQQYGQEPQEFDEVIDRTFQELLQSTKQQGMAPEGALEWINSVRTLSEEYKNEPKKAKWVQDLDAEALTILSKETDRIQGMQSALQTQINSREYIGFERIAQAREEVERAQELATLTEAPTQDYLAKLNEVRQKLDSLEHVVEENAQKDIITAREALATAREKMPTLEDFTKDVKDTSEIVRDNLAEAESALERASKAKKSITELEEEADKLHAQYQSLQEKINSYRALTEEAPESPRAAVALGEMYLEGRIPNHAYLAQESLAEAEKYFRMAGEEGQTYLQAIQAVRNIRDETRWVTPPIQGVNKSSMDAFAAAYNAYKQNNDVASLKVAIGALKPFQERWGLELDELTDAAYYFERNYEYRDNPDEPKYQKRFQDAKQQVDEKLNEHYELMRRQFEEAGRQVNPEDISSLRSALQELGYENQDRFLQAAKPQE